MLCFVLNYYILIKILFIFFYRGLKNIDRDISEVYELYIKFYIYVGGLFVLMNILYVVVMDFGIFFFGYVFVIRVELEMDLLKIYVFVWYILDIFLVIFKILMIILLGNDK